MRNVYVIGIGATRFGKLDMNIRQMAEEAVWKALKDANLKPNDLQVAYCGYCTSGHLDCTKVSAGHYALRELGIRKIPISRVESACASSSSAFREAWMCVASGLYDVALAFGMEKMTHVEGQELLDRSIGGIDLELESNYGLLPFGLFGMVVRRRMYDYGMKPEHIAKVSVKNRKHASLNPIAHFKKEITVEDVLNSYPVSDPVTLLMFCPGSDGGAATILASEEFIKKHTTSNTPIKIVTSVLVSGTYAYNSSLSNFQACFDGAKEAYERSGIGPEDIDVAEVHDACAAAEICHYESLGFCQEGEGELLVERGESQLGGRIPVNTGGGLCSRGHPLGATGCAQVNEIVQQLRGQAGPRQVENAKVGLAQNWGAAMQGDGNSIFVNIFTR